MKLTWEQVQEQLQLKMAEIRATKDFKERDWEELRLKAQQLKKQMERFKQ